MPIDQFSVKIAFFPSFLPSLFLSTASNLYELEINNDNNNGHITICLF